MTRWIGCWQIKTARCRDIRGSARVPRVGERVLAIANFPQTFLGLREASTGKDCCGETPQPARETRALPNPWPFLRSPFALDFRSRLALS